mmetsp:Transcript_15527/g.27576  ORF Transcript_15527/g.27576 Transcript_15527/m.27576 type:complete len:323 (+) Transcript_15527:202-1170(+)
MLLLSLLILNNFILALTYKSQKDMYSGCKTSLITVESIATREERRAAAQEDGIEDHDAFSEFPARQMSQILHHPSVRAVVEFGVTGTGGDKARFVDVSSGAGRVCLAVSTMHDWASVTGIEDIGLLHRIAEQAVTTGEVVGTIPKGIVRPLYSDGAPLQDEPMAAVLAQADLVFMHSTSFPTKDGLRLPYFSAALSSMMKEGSLAITTDRWLVGERFHFVDLMSVIGELNETYQVHIWRLEGKPPAQGFNYSLWEVEQNWMAKESEDLCEKELQGYDRACEALVEAIENLPEDFQELLKEVEGEIQDKGMEAVEDKIKSDEL